MKLLFFFVGILCIASSIQDQLKVSLYYEGLCPGCHQFIENQLYDGGKKLGDALILDLVPFGSAKHETDDKKITWTCQHGPLECYINKVHACAINLHSNQLDLLSFIYCNTKGSHSNNTQDEEAAISKQCAEENHLSWDQIDDCVNSDLSDKLLFAYEKQQKSLVPRLQYVPHIRFNDIFDETVESEALKDFFGTSCKLFQVKPKVCEETKNGEFKFS